MAAQASVTDDQSAVAVKDQGPRSAPVTVCHVILRLDYGGLENGLVMLINNLPPERFRHVVICLQKATAFRARIQRPDIVFHELHKKAGKGLRLYGRVYRLLREIRPDIVHTRNIPTIDMLFPAKLAGVPVLIHSEHGLDMAEVMAPSRKYLLLRRVSRLIVDRYLAVAQNLADWLHDQVGIPAEKIEVIYNGVDIERFRPRLATETGRAVLPHGFARSNGFVVGTVGRLEPVKDQTTLARAFVHALKRRPELRTRLRLLILGDGQLRGEIEAVLAEAKAADLAWLPGYRDGTEQIYRALDLFVLPSLREGTSNTILEAMASGLPVVATAVGGNPHLVADGQTGKLVPPNQPEALADAILGYAESPVTAISHGQAGRARILRDFSIEAMVKGYDTLYQSTLSARCGRTLSR